MIPIEIACRYQHPTDFWCCTAQAGEHCRMRSYLGNWYELIFFHDCRQADAAAMTEPDSSAIPISDKMIDDSGLI
jgi:hypothetical protein